MVRAMLQLGMPIWFDACWFWFAVMPFASCVMPPSSRRK